MITLSRLNLFKNCIRYSHMHVSKNQ